MELDFVEKYLQIASSNPEMLKIEEDRGKKNIHVEIEEEGQ